MKTKGIVPGLWTLAMEEAELRVFRAASYTETGLSYRAYLMETEKGYISIGSLPSRFAATWAEEVRKLAGEKGVSWQVLFGVDGDAAAYDALKAIYPALRLIAGEKTLYDLGLWEKGDGKTVLIRSKRALDLGGRKIQFHVLTDRKASPAVYLLDSESRTLFTADTFGADCALEKAQVSELADKSLWLRGAALYYADIYGAKRRKTMEKAVSLVRENNVKTIAPAFGPVVDEGIEDLLAIYEHKTPTKGEKPRLAVAYLPQDHLEELAQEIARGAEEGGVEACLYDLSAMSREKILEDLPLADAYLFGVPRDGGDAAKPVWDLLTSLKTEDVKGKYAAVFHSDGIDSSLPEILRGRFSQLGMNLNARDYFTTGKPTEQELKNAFEHGFAMACLMRSVPNPRKPSLVKCLVCGEIFDASLGVCPVCGVGLDQCVPVDEDAVMFKNNTDRQYLIVGGGVAGISAAEAIRRRDETGTITLLSQEKYLPINRPMLTKDLVLSAGDPLGLAVHDEAWYQEKGITVRLGTSVTSVDPEKKIVTADGGETFTYDKLIWAAGAECFVPPFGGKDKPGVLTIRHLEDSRELWERMKTAKEAVVIGGGVLGLEAASELVRSGIHVTVLEATPQIIGRQVDEGTAETLKGFMAGLNVACYEGVSIQEITGDGKADGVLLADGRRFPADFVIVSCGNRANVGPLKEAGAKVERAIVVDGYMRTSLSNVYACGDCCQFEGINYQLWQEATDQGRAAGANAAGEELLYHSALMGLSMEGFGTSLYAIGDPGKKSYVPYKTVETKDAVKNRSEKYWFYGSSLEGAVIIGSPEKTPKVQQAVTTHAGYDELF